MTQTSHEGRRIAAYLIDPNQRSIEPVTVTLTQRPDPLSEIYALLGCRLIASVPLAGSDVIYVDDEGLINRAVCEYFGVQGIGQPLAGRGLVVGTDNEGEDADVETSLDDIKQRVTFIEHLTDDMWVAALASQPTVTQMLRLDQLTANLAGGA